MLMMEVLTADGRSPKDALIALKTVFSAWARENINVTVSSTKTFHDKNPNGSYTAIMVILYRGPR